MSRWARGEADVEQLLARREMELTTGAQADGTALLEQARKSFGRKQLMAVISADASAEQRIEFGSQTT